MKKYILILLLINCLSFFGQENYVKHKVQIGETLTQIANKYKVSLEQIYKLNPDAKSGLKADKTLLIPTTKQGDKPAQPQKPTEKVAKTHLVVTGDTQYSVARKYKTTVENLQKLNPTIKANDIKIGQTIKITEGIIKTDSENVPKQEVVKKIVDAPKKEVVYHTVLEDETVYSIAKKYDISIDEIKKLNPEIDVENLKIDSKIKIFTSKKEIIAPKITPKSEPKLGDIQKKKIEYAEYTVQAKETLYSLSHKFKLDQKELIAINPSLNDGVNEGMIIKYPSDVSFKANDKKIYANLSKSLNKIEQKRLAILLPFNIQEIENDTVNKLSDKFKKDKFLNVTLDFYSGALMAIDSAKTLGLNVDIKIFDSQETQKTSNISNLIAKHDLELSDVIIGPLLKSNIEKTAELLKNSKAMIVSPISKDFKSSYSNMIVNLPTIDNQKQAVFEYMQQKNGNIIAVIDPNKKSSSSYLKRNLANIKIHSDKFTTDSIVTSLKKNSINYVILDSEKTSLVLKTINSLISLQKDYQIQLVTLEKNKTLDFDEIPLAKLVKLKLLYPSTIKENYTDEAKIFDKEYKLKNKIYPNEYAIRGFDLTFDILMRLSQDKLFVDTLDEITTEHIVSKFEYDKKPGTSYYNNGVYILEYQQDLTVKEAK